VLRLESVEEGGEQQEEAQWEERHGSWSFDAKIFDALDKGFGTVMDREKY